MGRDEEPNRARKTRARGSLTARAIGGARNSITERALGVRSSITERAVGMRSSLTAMNVAEQADRSWLPPLVFLSHNTLTLIGLFLVNAAAVLWLFVLPVATRESAQHPYLLIFFLGILPIAFVLGITLVPTGIYRRYRRLSRHGLEARHFEPLGWENREFRNLALFIVLASSANVLLGGYFSQSTVHYMDSPGFCATTCHSMRPEYAAYQHSPHVNIACVECHIGSGRSAYMRAKLNGLWQVTATAFSLFPRPIPTPLESLRPAREICESCHWPRKFSGIQLRVLDHFAEDSANTRTTTVLSLAIGGGPVAAGIHGFHMGPGITVEYASDPTRQEVSWVRYSDSAGVVAEFASDAWAPDEVREYEVRAMDCLDCHTRPSHQFQMPARALDEALALGRVDPTLPWIRKRGREVLEAEYSSTVEAVETIAATIADFYRSAFPSVFETRGEAIARSTAGLVEIYEHNVFPEMGVQWGTYPDYSGHTDFIGCFRCHGGGQHTAGGDSIPADCTTCHRLLAVRESEPVILKQLGVIR
jgi:nitrate/TMAO reductase-like tetraheme cytochrome c subunit